LTIDVIVDGDGDVAVGDRNRAPEAADTLSTLSG